MKSLQRMTKAQLIVSIGQHRRKITHLEKVIACVQEEAERERDILKQEVKEEKYYRIDAQDKIQDLNFKLNEFTHIVKQKNGLEIECHALRKAFDAELTAKNKSEAHHNRSLRTIEHLQNRLKAESSVIGNLKDTVSTIVNDLVDRVASAETNNGEN